MELWKTLRSRADLEKLSGKGAKQRFLIVTITGAREWAQPLLRNATDTVSMGEVRGTEEQTAEGQDVK